MTETQAYEMATRLWSTFIEYDKNPEICEEGVAYTYLFLSIVKNPSKELCIKALKQNGEALRFVPKELYDEDILTLAIKNWREAIDFIESKYLTKAMIIEHIHVFGCMLPTLRGILPQNNS